MQAQVEKAVRALLKHENLVKEKKPTLISEEEESSSTLVHLAIGLSKMPEKTSLKPVRLSIPHPFRRADQDTVSVCLITKDPQRFYKDQINPLKIPAITKIQGLTKLRAKFKPFEAKRQLCASFDLFLADERILPKLSKVLGKTFFDRKKQPVAVNLGKAKPETIREELVKAIESTLYFQTGGANTSIVVGTAGQEEQHIIANIIEAVKGVAKKLPDGLKSIRSLHIKTHTSAALPIFVRKSLKSGEGKKQQGSKNKKEQDSSI